MNQTHGTLFEYTWLWRVQEYGCLFPALVDDTVLVVAVGLQQPLAQVALQHKHTHSHQAIMLYQGFPGELMYDNRIQKTGL